MKKITEGERSLEKTTGGESYREKKEKQGRRKWFKYRSSLGWSRLFSCGSTWWTLRVITAGASFFTRTGDLYYLERSPGTIMMHLSPLVLCETHDETSPWMLRLANGRKVLQLLVQKAKGEPLDRFMGLCQSKLMNCVKHLTFGTNSKAQTNEKNSNFIHIANN